MRFSPACSHDVTISPARKGGPLACLGLRSRSVRWMLNLSGCLACRGLARDAMSLETVSGDAWSQALSVFSAPRQSLRRAIIYPNIDGLRLLSPACGLKRASSSPVPSRFAFSTQSSTPLSDRKKKCPVHKRPLEAHSDYDFAPTFMLSCVQTCEKVLKFLTVVWGMQVHLLQLTSASTRVVAISRRCYLPQCLKWREARMEEGLNRKGSPCDCYKISHRATDG